MVLFESSHLFSHPWPLLTTANWKKYPNEYSPHVLSVDVLNRTVDSNGIIQTERLVCCKQAIPSILRHLRLPIPETAYFLETSKLNPLTKEYVAKSVNLSSRAWIKAEETCVFKPDPLNPLEHTIFSQTMEISAASFSIFAKVIEEAAVSRFKESASKGRQGLQSVVDHLLAEAKGVEAAVTGSLQDLLK